MRFRRYERAHFVWNSRRQAAYLAKCRREQQALPLFAEQIRGEQRSVEDEGQRRERQWAANETRWRQERAALWRRARRTLANAPNRRELAGAWNGHRWLPGDPWYLLDLITQSTRAG